MGTDKHKTILLVEDEAIIAMTEKATLEKYGYQVEIAHSGEQAIAAVAATPGVDLILMDINLGVGMDGTEAAAAILKNHDLPIVFLSSHMEPEVVEKTEKITSYGYVVKDSSITVLDASIKMAFKLFEAKKKEMEKESQREAALTALRESEEWNKLILQTELSGIIVIEASTRKIVFANDTALKLIGLPEEQVIGTVCHRFICPAEKNNCPVIDFGQEVDFTERILLTSDGKQKNIIKKVVPMQTHGHKYLIESFVDITARKEAEKVIFQSKKDWEDCFDSITDMITVHDNDYNIVRTNKAAQELLKLPALEKHLTLKCFSFYHGTDAPPAGCPSCDCLKSGISGVFEMFEPHLDRFLEIRALPRLDRNNQSAGLIHIVRDITERKQSESQREAALEALRESEARYQAFFNTSRDCAYITSADGKWLFMNESAVELFGYSSREELKDVNIPDLYVNPQEHLECNKITIEKNYNKDFPVALRRKDGAIIHALITEVPRYDADSKLIGFQGTIRNITERKQVEAQRAADLKALRESEASFQKQRDAIAKLATNEAIAHGDVEKAKAILMETAAAILHVARASIWLLADNGRQMLCIDLFEAPARKHSEGITLKAEDYPRYFKALKEDSQVAANDARNDPRTSEFTNGYLLPLGISSMLDSALLSKDGVVGAICFEHVGEIRQWQPHEASFSNTLAALFSRTLAIDEQKRIEKALQVSEEQYRTLVETASDLVYSTDRAGHFTYVNRAVLTTTGYEERELIGKLYPTLIHPDIRKKAIKLFLSQIKNGTHNTYSEFPILTKDGREIWLGQNTQLNKKDGRVTGLQAVSRDITEINRVESQKQAALAALRESEERYRALVENASDLVFTTDRAGHFTFANLAARTVTGYEERELIGKMYTFLIRPDMRVRALRFYGRQLANGINNTYFEFPIITKDGREVWFGQNVQLRKENGQVTGVQAVTRDISERKQAEKLNESLFKISQAVFSTDNLYGMFKHVHQALSGIIPTDNLYIALLTADGKSFASLPRRRKGRRRLAAH